MLLETGDKAMEWQPIETAPLDGTPVLLFVPGVRSWNRPAGIPDLVVGLWEWMQYGTRLPDYEAGRRSGSWVSDIGDVDQGYESTGAYFVHEELQPTHWMPLPEPPAA